MESPYFTLAEAAEYGRYPTHDALRRDMERRQLKKGIHYFNLGGKPKGPIRFYKDKFIAWLEGRDTAAEPEAMDFSKQANRG